jgi:hypothetical protein
LGHLVVNKLTTVDIDDVYRHLLRGGGAEGRPLEAGALGPSDLMTPMGGRLHRRLRR